MKGMNLRQKIITIGVLVLIMVTLLMNTVVLSIRVRNRLRNDDHQTVQADDKTQMTTEQAGNPDRQEKEVIMTVIDPNKPMVAFTFDDGPYSPVTDRLVAAFENTGGNCTFFNMGERWEESYTSYINSGINAVNKGNEIGVHSYHHKDLTTLSASAVKKQVKKSCRLIEQYTGQTVNFVRPPYGSINETVSKNVGKPMMLWSLDSYDWSTRDANVIYRNVYKNIKDGSIVLMHDLYDSTAEAVERLLPKLKKQGYQFVTVSELYEYRGIELKDGEAYGNNAVSNRNSSVGVETTGTVVDDYVDYEEDGEVQE
jgi:peptidoglycan/xylan/chitin deacetylase (PgdA/CDA1 family)